MAKDYQKKLRVKYLRKLEKFANSASSMLKKEHFDAEKFKEKMLKNAQILKELETINLNSSYTKSLLEFARACLNFSKSKQELKELANALDKHKKQKKEKYKNYLKEVE